MRDVFDGDNVMQVVHLFADEKNPLRYMMDENTFSLSCNIPIKLIECMIQEDGSVTLSEDRYEEIFRMNERHDEKEESEEEEAEVEATAKVQVVGERRGRKRLSKRPRHLYDYFTEDYNQ